MSRYDLDGRVAIVTGASAGLGAEFADALAESGANVVLAARREDRIRDLASTIERERGVRALAVRTDVTQETEVVALVQAALEAFGTVDILVNNAGSTHASRLLDHTLDDWRSVIEVNLTAVFLMSREAARAMIPKRSGSIINIGSVYGATATRRFPIFGYYASKGGVTMLTKALAVELGKDNIRVNEIAPTFFPTEMSRDGMFADTERAERMRQELLWPRTALPTLAKNEYLRGAVCFLASDDSYYVTGTRLPVDGGWLAT
jgi:NAD(P)-dependent dehydrogenase (short-subunit alcohol dehydrogenase family)